MFRKSDYFILLAVMISFFISAYLWFVAQDREQAIFTAIWIPAIFWLRSLFQAGRPAGEKAVMALDLMFWGFVVFVLLVIGLVLTVREFRQLK